MGKHKTPQQARIMVEFMEKNPEARYTTKGNRVKEHKLWKELTISLNSHGPPVNSTEKWKKAWTDWKCTVKKKLTHIRGEAGSSNGGLGNSYPISTLEDRVANVAGLYTVADGIQGAAEFGLDEEEISINDSMSIKSSHSPESEDNARGSRQDHDTQSNTVFGYDEDEVSINDNVSIKRSHSPESEEYVKKLCKNNSTKNDGTATATTLEECTKSIANVLSALTDAINKQTLEAKRHNEEMEAIAKEQNKVLKELLKNYSRKKKK